METPLKGLREGMRIEGVAIIGTAIRFPGAKSLDELWKNLCGGVESITFFDDDRLDASVGMELKKIPAYVKARGVIEDVDKFDAMFFNISPREAQIMDPQARLFLELSAAALEDACYVPDAYQGLVGIFGGTGFNTYFVNHVLPNQGLVELFGTHATYLANSPDYLATRVSYKLDLRGPSVSVYTGCSTSLVAVCQAFDSLQSYQCDLAIAGGVFVQCPLNTGYLYQEGEIFSPDGHCRPFDEKAAGTVFSDGAGFVVLKRADEAIRDNDHIYAIIRGAALNNDGSDKVSFTAPSVSGQAAVISQAHANARINPEAIIYHEAHGTGTRLGDPIEIEALRKAFGSKTRKKQFCAIGSVKANLGHLDAAAGIAGLIKAVLVLAHKEVPPSINYDKPNPQIDFENSPFYVNRQPVCLGSSPGPPLASVSSFGVGGTNSHLVLEEAPHRKPSCKADAWNIIPISAKTDNGRSKYVNQLANFLRTNKDASLSDVAFTFQLGRKHFKHRNFVVCRNLDDAVRKLESIHTSHREDCAVPNHLGEVVFMFTGQGSQYVDMGKELYLHEPVFRDVVDLSSTLLKPSLGFDLREVLYPGNLTSEHVEKQINQTAVAQPALFVIEYALAKLLESWGVRPGAMVGHSIGEYVAACLAGVFDLDSALAIVAARSRFMQEMQPGAMLAVAASEARVFPMLNNKVGMAVVNAPELCVVSGEFSGIEELERQLDREKIGHKRLLTSHAFHSHMMEPAACRLSEEIARYELHPPRLPFLSNLSGGWITREQATNPDYWADQLRRAVRFRDCLETMGKDEGRIWLEVGPGNTLCTLARQHFRSSLYRIVPTMRRPSEKKSDSEFILRSLGELWSAGVDIDWHGFNRNRDGRRMPLPTYPFERTRHWIEAVAHDAIREDQPPKPSETGREPGRAGTTEGEEQEKKVPRPTFRSDAERRLADIWKELLNLPKVEPMDNYFELGGSSLFAVRMFDQIEKTFNKRLPLAILYEAPTVRELADKLGAPKKTGSWSSLVEINRGSAMKPPFFLIHSEGGNVLEYWPLSKYFPSDQPLYALQAKGLDGSRIIDQSVEEMADSFLSEIRVVQGKGPYYLGGYCLGGLVAYEVSQRLQKNGEKVGFLAMISTRTPAYIDQSNSNAGLLSRFIGRLVELIRMESVNLSELTLGQKWNYLRERVMRLYNIVQANSEGFIDKLFTKIGIEGGWHSRDYILYQSVRNQREAFYRYEPTPYPYDIVLFRVLNNPRFFIQDRTLGWSKLVRGDIRVFEVNAFHKNIMKEPNIRKVGDELPRLLALAQSKD
jgi:acyl transferase domain-containing protein/thioesterase domain-containing protein